MNKLTQLSTHITLAHQLVITDHECSNYHLA